MLSFFHTYLTIFSGTVRQSLCIIEKLRVECKAITMVKLKDSPPKNLFAVCQWTVHQQIKNDPGVLKKTDTETLSSTLSVMNSHGFLKLLNSWLTVGHLSVDCWPLAGCLLADCWCSFGRLLVDSQLTDG